MVFNNIEGLFAAGTETVEPSPSATELNCTICFEALDILPSPHSSASTDSKYPVHRAIRILSCSHIHGAVCLSLWLETAHTCPTCNGILFTPSAERAISQDDVNCMVYSLVPTGCKGPLYLWVTRNVTWNAEEEARRDMAFERHVDAERIQDDHERAKELEAERSMELESENAAFVEGWWDDEERDVWDDGECESGDDEHDSDDGEHSSDDISVKSAENGTWWKSRVLDLALTLVYLLEVFVPLFFSITLVSIPTAVDSDSFLWQEFIVY